jgi:hypothetical protein
LGLNSVASVSSTSRQLYDSHIDINADKELKIIEVFLSMISYRVSQKLVQQTSMQKHTGVLKHRNKHSPTCPCVQM